ncbi:hypothetical protein EZI54_07020 [Marinobacter halodurans]|uniref:DUF1328 domain-containing protein n=1 Tax=Marinobacter halodurans TaxID=2528979 RepID=A0ABY1ZPT0_9GAMM|nr:hypothetical protein [Marinobacter halodurans]TBW57402.1 hypothetical protein EZI54_07020 [Marinobacter halodurans]
MNDNRTLIPLMALFSIALAIVGFDAGEQYGTFEAVLSAAPGVGLFVLCAIKVICDVRRDRARR